MKIDLSQYLEVPFKHGGRNLKGLDCYGLIVHIYKHLGIELFDMNNYEKDWSKRRNYFLENYHKEWVKTNDKSKFDVVLFKTYTGRFDHVGVVVDDYRYIHAHRYFNVMISRLGDKKLKLKIEGFYRYKKK
jgi:cell wall-associated NlpC family hydrolase